MNLETRHLLATLASLAILAAAEASAANAPVKHTDENSTDTAVPSPDADTFLALERQATEAYFKGDGEFFTRILDDKLVMQRRGSRLGKAEVVRMISGTACEVRDGWTLSEPQMSKIVEDTYIFTYKLIVDGSCTSDGKTSTLPSPVRASSIWVRNGEKWQAVFHGEIPIFDPAATPAAGNNEQPGKVGKPDANSTAERAPAKPVSDPTSDALMAVERTLWDAWMNHDADRISALTVDEIAFVNLFGTYLPNKAAALADWTSEACKVDSFMLGNGVGSLISPSVGILTVTGTVRGTCGEQDISGQKIYGTTVYLRDGDSWKWKFGFNSPN